MNMIGVASLLLTIMLVILGCNVDTMDAASTLTTGAPVVPPQLNTNSFAGCLATVGCADCPANVKPLKQKYHIHLTDGLLTYLSVYAGLRIPGIINSTIQQPAYERWAVNFFNKSSVVAEKLVKTTATTITPSSLVAMTNDVCDDWLCVGVVLHNVLRTLGRHKLNIDKHTGADYNAPWFKDHKSMWLKEIPVIEKKMIPLQQPKYLLPERFGSWYHSFGLVAFGVHEISLFGDVLGKNLDEFIVIMNKLLNPFLAGGPESPVKHQVDEGAVQITFNILTNNYTTPALNCNNSAGYVRRPQ